MGKKLHPHYEYLDTTEALAPGDLIYFEKLGFSGTLFIVDFINKQLVVKETDTDSERFMPYKLISDFKIIKVITEKPEQIME